MPRPIFTLYMYLALEKEVSRVLQGQLGGQKKKEPRAAL